MLDALAAWIVPALLMGSVFVILILSLTWQRKGLTRQQQAMSHVEESLGLSRKCVEQSVKAVAIAEESLRNEREMIELLRRIADRT